MEAVYLIKSSNQLINNMAKRGNNFSDFERDIVIEPVGEKKAVIENKRTDAVFPDEKIAALEDITRQYNAVSQTGLRTSKQLHALYDFLKKAERSALSGDHDQHDDRIIFNCLRLENLFYSMQS